MSQHSLIGRAGGWVAFLGMALAWLIPNHYPPWTSYYNEVAMAVALVALAAGVMSIRRSQELPRSAAFVVAVALIPWVQYAAGLLHYSGDAFIASVYVVAVAIAIFVAHASTDEKQTRLALTLSSAALAAASVSAVLAVTQSFRLASWGLWAELASSDVRAVGNLAQPNNFATLLGLGALGAMYLYERAKLQRVLAFALVLLLVIASALAQSRISLMFGIVAIGAVWLLRRRSIVLRTPLSAVISLTVLHWALTLAMPLLMRALFDESLVTFSARSVGTPRYAMWALLLDAVNLVPWQGYGWLQVGAAELAVVDRYPPVEELWLQAHNVFVDLIVWCGWPIGLLLGGALLFWYVSRLRRVRSLDAAMGMLIISFFGVHALVELPYHYAYFLIPVGLWAGIVEREQGARTIGDARWFLAPTFATLAVVIGVVIEYGQVEEDFRLVRFENARIVGARAHEPAPDAPLLSSLTGFLRFARTEPKAGMSEEQLRQMDVSTKRYPFALSLVRYASALALNGRLEEARATFVKIRHLNGDRAYGRLKSDLHDKVADGESGLAELDRSLPSIASSAP